MSGSLPATRQHCSIMTTRQMRALEMRRLERLLAMTRMMMATAASLLLHALLLLTPPLTPAAPPPPPLQVRLEAPRLNPAAVLATAQALLKQEDQAPPPPPPPEKPKPKPKPKPKAKPEAKPKAPQARMQEVRELSGASLNTALAQLVSDDLYPLQAIERGWQGRVVLLLQMDDDGRLLSASVASSSGHAMLDAAALRASQRIDRIPGGRSQMLLPVEFRLE